MSIRKNTWDLDGHYDLTNSGLNGYVGSNLLFSWGYNTYGTLGLNDTTPRSSPTQVPGTQWSYFSRSTNIGTATKTDGTLWTWGLNSNNGQLGLNDLVNRSSPTQVPGTQWSKSVTGVASIFGIKTDGTLWSWGYGTNGLLGQNDRTARSSPVQIPGTQWTSISSSARQGGYNALGLKSDGTLWTWGGGGTGGLGLNDKVARSSPTQIPGTQWTSAKTGGYNGIATKSDGTLWAWGYNDAGE